MKKSLLALAVLGAFTGIASAQSSVTLFGTVDVNGRYVKADGQSRRLSEGDDGINSSQLGFRGVEDLGGGLKAGFTLISGFGANNGTTNAKFFNRRSTVSVLGGFGEVRLGRDYTPTFWNQTIFDAFGTLGLGSSINVRQLYGGTRMDNSIGYLLPSNIGGFYGQAMVAAANGSGGASVGAAPTADRFGRYVGGRIGFAAGPFDVSAAAGEQRRNDIAGAPQAKTYNIGGSWDFGVAKLLGYWDRDTLLTRKENVYSISALIPFGQSEVHVGYDRSTLDNSGAKTKVDQIKATYQYNLSKRTALYTTVSRLSNKDATSFTLPGAAGPTTAKGKSSGAEFGLRHFF
jgi:predicted porin